MEGLSLTGFFMHTDFYFFYSFNFARLIPVELKCSLQVLVISARRTLPPETASVFFFCFFFLTTAVQVQTERKKRGLTFFFFFKEKHSRSEVFICLTGPD